MQLLMETDVEGLIGAGRHERTAERATYRNGYRDRTLDHAAGGRCNCGSPSCGRAATSRRSWRPARRRRRPWWRSSRKPGSVACRPGA